MNKEEIIKQCLSLIDGFDGSDIEYLELLHELTDECEIRIEGKEMELGKKIYKKITGNYLFL